MNDMGKNLLLWLIIAAILLTVFQNFQITNGSDEIDYSTFLELVNKGQVRDIEVNGQTIIGTRYTGESFETVQPQISDNALIDDLLDHNVNFKGNKPEQQSIWTPATCCEFPDLGHYCCFYVLHAANARRRWWSGRSINFWKEQSEAPR